MAETIYAETDICGHGNAGVKRDVFVHEIENYFSACYTPIGEKKKYKAHISKYVRHILKYLRHIFPPLKTRLKIGAKTRTNADTRISCRRVRRYFVLNNPAIRILSGRGNRPGQTGGNNMKAIRE